MIRNLIALLCGVIGVLLALSGWHLYQDHQLIDAIRADLQRQQMRVAVPAQGK